MEKVPDALTGFSLFSFINNEDIKTNKKFTSELPQCDYLDDCKVLYDLDSYECCLKNVTFHSRGPSMNGDIEIVNNASAMLKLCMSSRLECLSDEDYQSYIIYIAVVIGIVILFLILIILYINWQIWHNKKEVQEIKGLPEYNQYLELLEKSKN